MEKNTPEWLNESRSMLLINYTSDKFIKILPKKSLERIEKLFNITLNEGVKEFINKKQLDKYNEPAINIQKEDNYKGYSDTDNESLDKLFNIESDN